ncbi:MAG: hypothetical protein ACI39U_05705 [Candidatus Cryptobacteroides sp.]
MKADLKKRKPRAGLMLIASPRFKNLSGPRRGSYAQKKEVVSKEIIASLDFLDLEYPGIVYEREDARKAMDLFYNAKVDFIIAEFLSWSEDFAWIRFLRDCPDIPIIFVNVAKDRMAFENTLDEDDFIEYLCSGTLVGSLEASGSLRRVPRNRVKTVMGTRAQVNEKIRIFSRAAKARAILKDSNLGLMANMNEAMWSTYIDNYDLFTKIGPEIHYLPYSDYKEFIDNLDEPEVEEYAGELASRYRMMDDVQRDKFLGCVRASLALKNMARDNDIDMMIYNDIDQATFKVGGCRAGFYHDWFNENMSILVPEADMGAGITTFVLKLISGEHVNFIEPFHIEDDFGTFAGGHAGPNDHNDPKWQQNVLIARDVRFAKTKWKYAGAPFGWYRISPGLKTVAGLFEEDGKYKLVCFLVESLPGEHILATYSHSIFKPQVPVKELFERVLKVGVTQHYAIADGDWREELADFAQIMDFELYDIR